MASLVDFYKSKLAPKLSSITNAIDQDKSMAGTQLAKGGLINQLSSRGIIGLGNTPSLSPVQVTPAKQFVTSALRPAVESIGTFGKLSFDALVNQPARNRQMEFDTQKVLTASNRALQAAKAAREAGRPDIAAQYSRSMIPQLQAESQKFNDITKQTQSKQKELIGSGVRSGLYVSAIANPLASIGAGTINAGLGAAFAGQTSPEQIGTSFGEGFKYGGMPNPVIKGSLLARSAGGGLVNLAEDALYAKTVEGRDLTPREVALSLALPAAFETGGKLLSKMKASPKEVVAKVDPAGLMYNKSGKIFDPINGRWVEDTMEARLAAKNTRDFIAAGGKPVKAGTKLVEISDGKWVDEQDLNKYASDIPTTKLSVEPTGDITSIQNEVKRLQNELSGVRQRANLATSEKAVSKVELDRNRIESQLANAQEKLSQLSNKRMPSGLTLAEESSPALGFNLKTPSGEIVTPIKELGVGSSGAREYLVIDSTGKQKIAYGKNPNYAIDPSGSEVIRDFNQNNKTIGEIIKPLSVEPVGGITDNANQFLSSVRTKFPDNNEKEMFNYAKKIADIRGSKQIDIQDIAEAVQYSRKIKGLGEDVGFSSLFSKDRTGTEILDRMKEVGVKDIDTSIYNVRDQVKNKLISLDKDTQSFVEAIARREGLVDVDGRISKRGLEILNNIIPSGKPTIQDIAKKMDTYKKVLSPSPLGGRVEPVAQGGLSEPKTVTPIRKSLKEVYKEQLTKAEQTPQLSTPQETIKQITSPVQPSVASPTLKAELPVVQPVSKIPKIDQPSESIIQEARKQIGTTPEPPKETVKQSLDKLYTQWVDRYNPLTIASQVAKKTLKAQGAELRPEYDPTYLVRRLTGAGGIADARFRRELNPVLKEMETLNIPKSDMDVYLANKRMAGFGTVGRDIYGVDPVKAGQVVSALEAKYPQINDVAQKMYAYQDKGLNEIAQAGFLSPEAVANLKSQNPDYAPLYRVMDEMDEYLGLPTRKTMQGTSPISKIKGSTRQIESPVESIIANTFRQRAAIEKNRVAQSVVDLQKISPDLGFTKVAKSAPDTITVWRDGQKEYWKVGQEIADTAKGVNEESMNLVLKVLQAPASLLRQGATGRNPEFMIPNIIRDQLDAAVASKYGYVPFVDFVSGLKSMITNDDVYKKWESSGAKIDLGELSGKKDISALFNEKVEKKKLFSWLGDALDVMGKYSEQPTRVGLFKKAYQKTGNELLSAMESRDATVDFARMGSKMKVANSIIPFLNVGVQGFDKLVRMAKNDRGKLAFNLAVYAVAPQVMSTLYNLIKYPEEYKEVPQYEKDSNFILINGRNDDGTVNYVTIPKGNIMPVATNPTQSFLEYAFSNDPQSFKEMALRTLSGTLPVLGEGSSLKEIGIKTIGQNLPQALKPITENLLNKSFYKYDPNKEQTKDIVPTYMQNKLPYQQKYDFTPQMYQKIGAVLNASPLKVQNLMEGYLAGYSKIPAQIVESLHNLSKGNEVSNNDKTILRRFMKTTYPSSAKPAPEKQPVPSLMERVTGKVGASEVSTTKPVPQWQIDSAKETLKNSDKTSVKVGNLYLVKQTNGDVTKLDISNVVKMPSSTNYETVKKEVEKWKVADDILKLDPTDQQEAFKQLGISKDDATYYQVAKDSTEAKAAYIKDQVQGVKTYDEFLKKVAPLAREVNGAKILSDGVIDWMYNNDIITSAQKKQLKSLEYDNVKKVSKITAKKGTTKVKKITAPKLSKFNLSSKVKKVKRIRTKEYKLKI